MELNDDTKIEFAKNMLLNAVNKVCEPDSRLSALLVVTDGEGLLLMPVGLTKREAFTILVAACTALEPEDAADNAPGELH